MLKLFLILLDIFLKNLHIIIFLIILHSIYIFKIMLEIKNKIQFTNTKRFLNSIIIIVYTR